MEFQVEHGQELVIYPFQLLVQLYVILIVIVNGAGEAVGKAATCAASLLIKIQPADDSWAAES
ncbi:hypothetical protein TRIUR3_34101 [Triticum urartu]|uniref:Uncharacterized protein n=1 Tax=Triticum urartu TaxID=4572 RepID=M8A6T7_TRIUA|nr:hypothetical protein TRIUR3_34101 [Triticum urartu]